LLKKGRKKMTGQEVAILLVFSLTISFLVYLEKTGKH
jgi:hypothetical protein